MESFLIHEIIKLSVPLFIVLVLASSYTNSYLIYTQYLPCFSLINFLVRVYIHPDLNHCEKMQLSNAITQGEVFP